MLVQLVTLALLATNVDGVSVEQGTDDIKIRLATSEPVAARAVKALTGPHRVYLFVGNATSGRSSFAAEDRKVLAFDRTRYTKLEIPVEGSVRCREPGLVSATNTGIEVRMSCGREGGERAMIPTAVVPDRRAENVLRRALALPETAVGSEPAPPERANNPGRKSEPVAENQANHANVPGARLNPVPTKDAAEPVRHEEEKRAVGAIHDEERQGPAPAEEKRAPSPTPLPSPVPYSRPAALAAPVAAAEPTKAVQPTKTAEPTKAVQPTKTAEPTKAVQATKAVEPETAPAPIEAAAAPPALLPGSGGTGTTSLLLAVIMLLGLAAGAVALTRRRARRQGLIQIVESVAIGPKRSLLVARVNGQTLILGCSEAGITMLGTLGARGEPHFVAPERVAESPARQADPSMPPPPPPPPPLPLPLPFQAAASGRAHDTLADSEGDGESESGVLGRLFRRKSKPAADDASAFRELLDESLEDQELRRKLSEGLAGKVA